VVEADEYDRSFLHLHPEIAIINSVDADHLDIYGTEEEVRASYQKFAAQVKPGGSLLLEARVDIETGSDMRFGIETGEINAQKIIAQGGFMQFTLDVKFPAGKTFHFEGLQLPYPGLHNVRNAIAAIAATLLAGGDATKIAAALANFKGVKRRFETIAKTVHTVYIDDYAHHPAELEAAISAARLMFPSQKITGVFQPHLFSRTRDFADAFARALDQLDVCLLLPIYPARELPIEGVSSDMLLDKMSLKNKKLIQKSELLDEIKNQSPEVLMTMGAGDIDTFIAPIKQLIDNQA
jgi:UDP-N-acetylmuramate--alanine ligase